MVAQPECFVKFLKIGGRPAFLIDYGPRVSAASELISGKIYILNNKKNLSDDTDIVKVEIVDDVGHYLDFGCTVGDFPAAQFGADIREKGTDGGEFFEICKKHATLRDKRWKKAVCRDLLGEGSEDDGCCVVQ